MTEAHKGQKMLEKAEEVQEFWAYDLGCVSSSDITFREDNKNIYKCKHWKLLSIESLSLDVKYEFNSDNQRMYSGKDGATLLAEGKV